MDVIFFLLSANILIFINYFNNNCLIVVKRVILFRFLPAKDYCLMQTKKPLSVTERLFAVRTGLEPVTPCVTGMYSNQLN